MTKGAMIVETRNIPGLSDVIKKHMKFLPEWGLTIFCGDNNSELMKEFPQATFHKTSINSPGDYNKLLTNRKTWSVLPYDKVLVFQHDSMLLREGIDEFLQWDYVGAPWAGNTPHTGANGGLSLRTRDIMIKIINKYPYWAINEDVYFCKHIAAVGGKLAPREVCEMFSCEVILRDGTLGQHAVRNRYGDKEADRLENQYKNK